MKQLAPIVAVLIVLGAIAGLSPAAQSPPFNLQGAIDAAEPGAVIRVPSGVYRGNFVIEKSVTLEGVDRPVLDGGNT
ncbi:MAG: nitrous oxide reductase family maturation protein NosD, partial [Anaerolineae bacterium]